MKFCDIAHICYIFLYTLFFYFFNIEIYFLYSIGITHHAGRTFAVYAISVNHFRMDGSEEKWFVVRRYSEFYDFHEAITSKVSLILWI